MGLLDLVFPKTCVGCGKLGFYICRQCRKNIQFVTNHTCPVCGRASILGTTHPKCQTRLALNGLYCLVYYSDPIPQALYKLKYKFVKDLAESLVEYVNPKLPSFLEKFYLTPIPLHGGRQRWRDFNQSELLASFLAEKLKLKLKTGILKREKATRAQVNLSREKRKENVKEAFECIDKDSVRGEGFLLFDDVWTSGATLKNCATVLKRAGAEKVWGLTLARSR